MTKPVLCLAMLLCAFVTPAAKAQVPTNQPWDMSNAANYYGECANNAKNADAKAAYATAQSWAIESANAYWNWNFVRGHNCARKALNWSALGQQYSSAKIAAHAKDGDAWVEECFASGG